MKKEERRKIYHTLKPIYRKESKLLILGSLPSQESRNKMFYYAHPRNRFWKLLADIYKEDYPQTIGEKTILLKKHKIALFDVIKSCTIIASGDSSIKDVEVNDIKKIVERTKITKIYTTGKKAYELYNKYLKEELKMDAIYLLSPSPANAAVSYDNLLKDWTKKLLE